MGEFDTIARHFAPLARAPGAFGLTDDAAVVIPPEGKSLVVTTDVIVAGRHFPVDESPEFVARRLQRANLSDLAAMGATPLAYFITVAAPMDAKEDWFAEFAAGLRRDQEEFEWSLMGGDTVATPGAATFTLVAMGHVGPDGPLRRSGARPGDLVGVSGDIGDAALGLLAHTGRLHGLSASHADYLIDRYRLPRPRVSLGQALCGLATAAIDVSDGLIADLGHIASTSNVHIKVDVGKVPMSHSAAEVVADDPDRLTAVLTGGDDYELAFTAPAARMENLRREWGVTEIGRVETGSGVAAYDRDGDPLTLPVEGFAHF